ncbi:flavodoxin family protein [Xylanimonas protaetiae]|uniref:Flavodoxin/nitric oxide synthase n=1 Tax=Xylanimonas protaetiae TaxID=2509457 RepID=A0A4P6F8T8_9MICO|nr:flavodoxin domain-containing protein [Xylanimonas protaetiae]QAY70749.1 flavodoxin/nitric oxide synthase [Xylanimonas protaetiae]
MRALIVVETCFGNTEQVAHAIAAGLRSRGADVEVAAAVDADDVLGRDLLVVGSPTHSMGLPGAATRRQARAQGGHPHDTGVSEWLDTLPRLDGQRVVAFATVTGGFFSGSAAKAIERRLRKLSAAVAAREDFRVTGVEGPLVDGELERATRWGASLA